MQNRRARILAGIAFGLALGAGNGLPVEAQRSVRVGQPAPEITGGPWINSEPLTLAALRGRVVLVEFWTYG
jgi:hypothetical protein